MNLEANRKLAGLLGWTNIVEVAGALLGTPPPGEPECRGQAQVPDWVGDWRACGPLQSEHRITVECLSKAAMATAQDAPTGCYSSHAMHGNADAATRHSIVRAACELLESQSAINR